MLGFFKQTPSAEAPSPLPTSADPTPGWRDRLFQGLAKSRAQLGAQVRQVFSGGKADAQALESLEDLLLMGDVGVSATQFLMDALRQRTRELGLETPEALHAALSEAMVALLTPLESPPLLAAGTDCPQPTIILMAGVNGAGKTTSIGKLAKYLQQQGRGVVLAAGDTFRAAAREQLMTWGERNGVRVIAQESGDPAAVVFDAIHAAKAKGTDVVLADTAGRLPTQLNLMDEIAKIKRVIQKAEPSGPHEVLLVLDANTGQNAIQQLLAFDKALGVTGLILTKLDGSAKGGVLAAIARQCPKPIRFIGVGEGIDDLRPFVARDFVEALLG